MLASGYLGGETEEDPKFVIEKEPGEAPAARWYRTGDRGRFTSDGRLRVLGRLDVQLNVDGFRVDPVEVENALRLHPSVKDAAAWTHHDGLGRSRLIAYIVDRTVPASAAELRSFLVGSLPPPLVPARFIHVEALPLTSSGKVDRAGLPNPDRASNASPRAAGNETESKVLGLFREVLEAPGLGIDDDFFEWGGDSLKAFALMTRISEVMGVRLPAAAILNAPSAGGLAIEVARGDPGEVSTVWLRKAFDLAPLVCLPGLAGDPLWFHPLIEALDRRQPLLGLSFVGLKPPIAIPSAASRAIDALRAEQPHGPYLLLGHSVGGVLAFEMARELVRLGEAVAFVGLIDTYVPGQRRIRPLSGVARWSQRTKRFRNRMIGKVKERLRGWRSRLGLPADRRGPVFIPGLKEAAMNHRVSACELKVTLFQANERSLGSDLAADWAPLARGGVEVIAIAGHHFNLITGGRARDLSARIAGAVARARTSYSRGSVSPSR
jgi:enterobactin synthetase component F